MRSSNPLARSLAALTRTSPGLRRPKRPTRFDETLRLLTRSALCLMLLAGQSLFTFSNLSVRAQIAPAPVPVEGSQPLSVPTSRVAGERVMRSVVNVRELVSQEARRTVRNRVTAFQEIPAPMSIQEQDTAGVASVGGGDSVPTPSMNGGDTIPGPAVPSPSPSTSFQGEFDEAKGGGPSGTFTIPPDTTGAVGIDKVVTHVNNNYVVHDKTTGARLSVVSIDAFWASTGATGVFDPRVLYDRYNNRWLVAAVSNAQTANSSVLVGISNTSDPQGTYTLFRFIVGCAAGAAGCNAGGEWADFPMLGFNKNWVAVTWNHFTSNTNAFIAGRGVLMDYPQLRSGVNNSFTFSVSGATAGSFCLHPATTYSPTENVLYFVAHVSSGGATYRVFNITGAPPTAPTLGATGVLTRPGGGWTQPGADTLPQTCVGVPGTTCPTTLRRIDSGDAFIRSNVVFRNGRLWYGQTIGLPAGRTATTIDRTAAQWTAVTATTGAFFDGGRVDDATATATNGGSWYAYPSVAVNDNDDMIVGYSEFESDDFADAGYSVRLGTDPAGTTRDPVIYKEGEDYYSKAFSGTRNRWGDYSHSVIDPVNDRDLWTLQEYAGTRTVPNANTTTNNSRWGTWWAKVTAPAGLGDLLISEFRVRGPNGANDEFIEIYNNTGASHTVNTIDGSAGYAVAAQDNVIRCTIPNGTVIPAGGHYLCVNSVGYSLAAYPAGNGTTATGDATYTTDIPDNNGVAIFRSATTLDATTRIDSVGFTTTPPSAYVEGTGLPTLTPFSIDHSFYRDLCGKGGSITTLGPCPMLGLPKDTDDNAADFIFVDTNGTSAGAGQRLGAPGPENLSSPIQRNSSFGAFSVDSTVSAASPPNRVRDTTSDPANNSTFGTLDIRRRYTNNTGAPVTRLRFRIIDITTFPAPSGFADMRARTSTPVVVSGINDPATCPGGVTPCTITIEGTTLEEPPSQPNGGAFNSTLSAGTITLANPLAAGQSISVRFLLGLQQTGTFKFFINLEALP
ncbi:MAG TPA: lamin tail domain-containing protein [Pyrinomonadaceae bacterium]|nr:lamin tail domain-containing protein [Pyrinomonadaceae bacterium]